MATQWEDDDVAEGNGGPRSLSPGEGFRFHQMAAYGAGIGSKEDIEWSWELDDINEVLVCLSAGQALSSAQLSYLNKNAAKIEFEALEVSPERTVIRGGFQLPAPAEGEVHSARMKSVSCMIHFLLVGLQQGMRVGRCKLPNCPLFYLARNKTAAYCRDAHKTKASEMRTQKKRQA